MNDIIKAWQVWRMGLISDHELDQRITEIVNGNVSAHLSGSRS